MNGSAPSTRNNCMPLSVGTFEGGALPAFVQRELKSAYGDKWLATAKQVIGPRYSNWRKWDAADLLRVIWNDISSKTPQDDHPLGSSGFQGRLSFLPSQTQSPILYPFCTRSPCRSRLPQAAACFCKSFNTRDKRLIVKWLKTRLLTTDQKVSGSTPDGCTISSPSFTGTSTKPDLTY